MAERVGGSEGARPPLKNIKINREKLELPNWNGGFRFNSVPGPFPSHRPSRTVTRDPGSSYLGWYGYAGLNKTWTAHNTVVDACCAAHWMQRASDAEAKGKYQEAIRILQEGKKNSAKPESDLDRALGDIIHRWQSIKDYEEKQAAEKVARRLHKSSILTPKSSGTTPRGFTQAIPLPLTQHSSTTSDSKPGRKAVTPVPSGFSGKKGLTVQFRADVEIINSASGQMHQSPRPSKVCSSSVLAAVDNKSGTDKESSGAGWQMLWPARDGGSCSPVPCLQIQRQQIAVSETQTSEPKSSWCVCKHETDTDKRVGGDCMGTSDACFRVEPPETSDRVVDETGMSGCNTKDAGNTPFAGRATDMAAGQQTGVDLSSAKDVLAWMLGQVFSVTLHVMEQEQPSRRRICHGNEEFISPGSMSVIGDSKTLCNPAVEHPADSAQQAGGHEPALPIVDRSSISESLVGKGRLSCSLANAAVQPTSSSLQSPPWFVPNRCVRDQVLGQHLLQGDRLPGVAEILHRQPSTAFSNCPVDGFNFLMPGPRPALSCNQRSHDLLGTEDGMVPSQGELPSSSPVLSLCSVDSQQADGRLMLRDPNDEVVQLRPTPSLNNRNSYSLAASTEGVLHCPGWRASGCSFGAVHPTGLLPHTTSPSLAFTGSHHNTGTVPQHRCMPVSQSPTLDMPRAASSRQARPMQPQLGPAPVNFSSGSQATRHSVPSSMPALRGRNGRGRSNRSIGRSGRS